jgi:cytoskeletal protein RodZ
VLTGLDALRDPVRPPRKQDPAPAEMTTVTPRRPAAEPVRETDGADDVDDADRDDEPEERGLVGRLTSRPVIAAVGVGAVLVLAAIVAFFTTSEPEAAPAEATPAAVSAPVVQPEPTVHAIALDSEKATAFLTALRDADIPTSSSGQAEVEAADAICAQLDQGADQAQLARSVPAVLPNVTRGQASDVVDFAQQFYC